ncbi:MAG: type II toxin-antitoxin system RelE/ParE family toxin [Rhodoplanes sp.]|uniref:type II toxin-antitoxin system RelE/ParE family toxin n=1 Tax=Rhodoplanes sp. TaxID=1968906 RepID=UPI0017B3CD9E|nr:type II toxin-antitoxin system RelE/ParE family toxin [Rhodoplanes sp.]NVO13713.1 type II toxin-antitoxin system RelE/ParE family toxin [Rhodoplanes sp.]
MKLRYRTVALADLAEIRDYIAQDDPEAARKVIRRIDTAVDRLRRMPWSGRPGEVPGTRILVVPGLPYVVIYRVGEDAVDIVAVLHTARNRRT